MGYIKEVLERANVVKLREFLLSGAENCDDCCESYDERLKTAYCNFGEVAKSEGITDDSLIFNTFSNALAEYEQVFMEVGMLAGFKLAMDVLKRMEGVEK